MAETSTVSKESPVVCLQESDMGKRRLKCQSLQLRGLTCPFPAPRNKKQNCLGRKTQNGLIEATEDKLRFHETEGL